MSRAFADITFTPSVKAAQSSYGSREANLGFELADDPRNELTDAEVAFISQRDSFYQATVSENGWPYVQHRGGPVGFLKVLDSRTLGFADFRGNLQYLSVGNLSANERISLILMDYPNRARLKIWGRVSVVREQDDPELISKLEVATYRARVERGMVIHIEALDWNCPQHITPRYSEVEVEQLLAPLMEENQRLKAGSAQVEVLGDGPLELVISGVRQLATDVRAFELRRPDSKPLPKVAAGAHLRVPVVLPDGELAQRHYSISSNPERRDAYEIAVLNDASGRGGSAFAHQNFVIGMKLRCEYPRNDFPLHNSFLPTVLIAGGIGITAIKPMAQTLKRDGVSFQLHYAGRSASAMAYRDRLQREFDGQVHCYYSDREQRMDLNAILSSAADDALIYVCGPNRLIDAVAETAQALGISLSRIKVERFSAPAAKETDRAFEVELQRSGKLLSVAAGQSILHAVQEAGVPAVSGCGAGNCGTCAVGVVSGTPDHRDTAKTPEQHNRDGQMCICVSRAKNERLVLDL